MNIEKSCICVFKGFKQFLTQGQVSTWSYCLSSLDVNQSQDSPQVLLRHLSNYLRTVPPILACVAGGKTLFRARLQYRQLRRLHQYILCTVVN